MKAWLKKLWEKIKSFVLGILVAIGIILPIMAADDVTLSWTNATQNTDGSALPIEDIAATILYKQVFPLGTDYAGLPRSYVEVVALPATTTSYVEPNQVNGIHCYVAIHVHVNTSRSVDSAEACKTIDVRIPGAPEGMTAS